MQQALTYFITAALTHHLASIIQVLAHWFLGHRALGGFLQRIHAFEHHGIYAGELMVSDRYLDEARSADYYYAVPGLALAASAYCLLPLDIFLVHLAALGLSTFAHFYLHVQYHLRNTWLHRFRWFQRKQRLHLLHHKDMTKNFAVIEFVWDHLLGTYADAAFATKA